MKQWIALAFLVAVPAVAAAPGDVDITGTWSIVGDVQGVEVVETCTLIQKDVVLSGSCDTPSGKYDTTGKIDGKTASFHHGGKYNGTDFILTLTGKLGTDGAMNGTLDVDPFGATGSFIGKKTAAPPAS